MTTAWPRSILPEALGKEEQPCTITPPTTRGLAAHRDPCSGSSRRG